MITTSLRMTFFYCFRFSWFLHCFYILFRFNKRFNYRILWCFQCCHTLSWCNQIWNNWPYCRSCRRWSCYRYSCWHIRTKRCVCSWRWLTSSDVPYCTSPGVYLSAKSPKKLPIPSFTNVFFYKIIINKRCQLLLIISNWNFFFYCSYFAFIFYYKL